MDNLEFRAGIYSLWPYSAQATFARLVGVNSRSVRRWCAGDVPVPSPIAHILTKLLERQTDSQ